MELVTDRTDADVRSRSKKGVYGPEDLNRVETAVSELVAMARQLDKPLELVTKTDWAPPGQFPDGFPTRSEMDRYLSNVRRIRDAFGLRIALPSSMRRLTHQGANSIERVLEAAFLAADQTIPNFIFCGELFAGEE